MAAKILRDLLRLVTGETLRPASAGHRTPLHASESDKGRIVNSAAFRRLQQKAQVFPLDPNASVRTRLTHSIEVSQLGKYLAQRVIEKMAAGNEPYREMAALVNVVENACLLHDIGNPPFGHLGEAAIREWFSEHGSPESDLKMFDGNPQGFRQVALLSGKDEHGMNLTCSLLLATVKYPWRYRSMPQGAKKIGIFDAEWKHYEHACDRVGWTPTHKFPFLLLMEAADDIAYSMSDLEDGLEKKIIRIEDLADEFGEWRFASKSVHPMIAFKTSVINEAVESAAEAFTANAAGILAGNAVRLITLDSDIGRLMNKVNEFARKQIYSHPSAERVELAGRNVICGLLTHFKLLLDLPEDEFVALVRGDARGLRGRDFHLRLIRLLPKSYKDKYLLQERGAEMGRREHLIVDFISGMTDHYALETYQVLQGIRIQ